MLLNHVRGFTDVAGEVKEFPAIVSVDDEFPLALANRKGFTPALLNARFAERTFLLTGEALEKADAVFGSIVRERGANDVCAGCEDVSDRDSLDAGRTGFDFTRPNGKKGFAVSAFVNAGLVLSQGRIFFSSGAIVG